MKTFIAIFLFTVLPAKAGTIKIFLLHSHSLDNFSGSLQMYGAQEAILRLKSEGHDLVYKAFYMNTDTKNTTEEAIQAAAKAAYKSIFAFKPTYVFVLDDNAFRYVAVPYFISKKRKNVNEDIKIIFSGLNKPYKAYGTFTPLDDSKVGGVQELYDLQDFKDFLNTSYLTFHRIYMLYDSSPTSNFILRNIEENLKLKGIKNTERIKIISTNDLKRKLDSLNKKGQGIILVALSGIKDTEKNITIGMIPILKQIMKFNRKHLEVGTSNYATQPEVGFATAIGPNFYYMGRQAGQMLVNDFLSEENQLKIATAKTSLSANVQRINELGLREVFKKSTYLFDDVDTKYD